MIVWTLDATRLAWLWMAAAAKPEKGRGASVSAIDDGSLVERARKGDRKAEDQLYRRHGRAVLNTVARLLGSKQDAPDIAQDTFLYAFTQIDQLREPKKFRSWILRIAVMRVRQTIRRRRLQRRLGLEHTSEDASLRALSPDQWSPEMRAQLSMVDDMLARLPVEQKLAWTLRYVEGHKLREVAEMGGWSMSSAKRYIKAADEQIQRRVKVHKDDDGEVDDE